MTVVDASAVVDLLLPTNTEVRDRIVAELPHPFAAWLAPDILVYEVFAVIRRKLLRGLVPEAVARRSLQRLRALPVELIPSNSLLGAAWQLRDNFAAADSLYAALALRAAEPLLTTDVRLARAATEAGIGVQLSD